MHFIYKITNKINNKIYIGQTNNPLLRWSQHKSNAKYDRGQQVITRAITKYGSDNFDFEVIASCQSQEDVNLTEEQMIAQYNSRNPEIGYNIDAGGNTTPRTPEVLQKISEGLRKHYETHDGWLKGGNLSEEWKENISKASIGKEGANTGKTFSDEWRGKMSTSLAGKEMKSRRRFSEEVEKEICHLYVEERKSTNALANQFDCYKTTISDILIRNKVERRRKVNYSNGRNLFTIEQELEICNLYTNTTLSRTEISKKYNCGKTTIRDILLRHHMPLQRS
jgi:group I intron endonuclease